MNKAQWPAVMFLWAFAEWMLACLPGFSCGSRLLSVSKLISLSLSGMHGDVFLKEKRREGGWGKSPWNPTKVILEQGFSTSGLLTVWLDSSLLWGLSCESQRCLQSLPSVPCEGKIVLLSRLYLFLIATVTNCHRFSGLQQISFLIVLEVRSSKAKIAKFKSRAVFCLAAVGKICFFAFSSFYRPPAYPFLCLPGQLHSIFKSFSMTPVSLSRLFLWLWWSCLRFIKTHWIIPDNLSSQDP